MRSNGRRMAPRSKTSATARDRPRFTAYGSSTPRPHSPRLKAPPAQTCRSSSKPSLDRRSPVDWLCLAGAVVSVAVGSPVDRQRQRAARRGLQGRVRRLPRRRHPGPRLLVPALRRLRPRQAASAAGSVPRAARGADRGAINAQPFSNHSQPASKTDSHTSGAVFGVTWRRNGAFENTILHGRRWLSGDFARAAHQAEGGRDPAALGRACPVR